MAVDLRSPEHIRIRLAGGISRPIASRSEWLGVVIRGLLTGIGTALVLLGGSHAAVISVVAVGILALGVALVSWDR